MTRDKVEVFLRRALRVLGLAGFVICASLFVVTMATEDAVERAAQAFVKYRIEREAREQLSLPAQTDGGKAVAQLQKRYEADIAAAKQALDDKLPERIAETIAKMCRLDCKKKDAARAVVASGYHHEMKEGRGKIATLSRFVEDRYLTLVASLTRDVRIFLGSNALLFALITLLAWIKPQASIQLTLPGLLLLTSTVISAIMYVFGQNWFFTLLHNDFVGFGYLAYALVLFAFLCDIALNKARGTSLIVSIIGGLFGVLATVTAC